MTECKHVWHGNADGVRCVKCGKTLTHDEFVALTSAPKEKKTAKKKKD